MLKQHEFYLYHQGALVMARARALPPVVAKEYPAAQEAHDHVQAVINPDGLHPSRVCPKLGFNHPDWQAGISAKCEAAVRAAYAVAGVEIDGAQKAGG